MSDRPRIFPYRDFPRRASISYLQTHYVAAMLNLLRLLTSLAIATQCLCRPSLRSRQDQGLACNDPNSPADPSCYEALSIPTWLSNWNQTIPRCPINTDSNCCVLGESWSNCFLRLAQGKSGSICNYLARTPEADTRCDFDQWKPVVDPSIAGLVRYIGWNLFSKLPVEPGFGIRSPNFRQTCNGF